MFYNSNGTVVTIETGSKILGTKIISDETWNTVSMLLHIVSCTLCPFGIVTNIINTVIFCRQGFSDSVNVSLLGLAVSDVGGLLSLLWSTVCKNPLLVKSANLPFSVSEIQYLTAGYPRIGFSRIAYWITIFITVQRCLCTAFPFQIKTALNPRRTTFIVASIFVTIFLVLIFPNTGTGAIHMKWKFYPQKNKTLLGLEFSVNFEEVKSISNFINTFVLFMSFLLSIFSTAILVFQLNERSKRLATMVQNSESILKKDARAGKMTILLSVILIVCYVPSVICAHLLFYIPGYNVGELQENFFVMTFSISSVLEAVNSSVTIFVYHKMSSKFRFTFNQLFCLLKERHNGLPQSKIF